MTKPKKNLKEPEQVIYQDKNNEFEGILEVA